MTRLGPMNHVHDVDSAFPRKFSQVVCVAHGLTSMRRPVRMAFDGCASPASQNGTLLFLVGLEGIEGVSHRFGRDHHRVAGEAPTFG